MGYFSGDLTRDKLILLCIFSSSDMPLTKPQLLGAVSENEWTNYFDFSQSLHELEQSALIAMLPTRLDAAYFITPSGRDAYALFKNRLPESLRTQIGAYIKAHRTELLRQTQYTSEYSKNVDGTYTVVLGVSEQEIPLMDVRVRVPMRETAKRMCAAWQENADEVYKRIFTELLEDPEPKPE